MVSISHLNSYFWKELSIAQVVRKETNVKNAFLIYYNLP